MRHWSPHTVTRIRIYFNFGLSLITVDGAWECAASRTSSAAGLPSPTGENCVLHVDHYHCDGDEAAEESGECIIHVGHTHGDCSAEDLACGAVLMEDYNMGLHIGALFIILVTSGLGVAIPLISGWKRKSAQDPDSDSEGEASPAASSVPVGRREGVWGKIFFVARHFGTGIILSTAFIHLLYHGFVMFANDCIGELAYESTAPAIALAAAFITFLLDLIGCRAFQNAHGAAHTVEQTKEGGIVHEAHAHGHQHFDPSMEQNWQVLLLEAGILFHSIMIGVTLGAGSGNGWTTLLIVIVFHQFFEGLALGARVALLKTIPRSSALLMGAAFTLITPIGIAIGIGVRKSFSQNGKASLLSVGILNSISAGILLYTAFRLLSSDFTEGPLRHARPLRITIAIASMVAGMICMSVLGKWA